jgi:hypothetical protein
VNLLVVTLSGLHPGRLLTEFARLGMIGSHEVFAILQACSRFKSDGCFLKVGSVVLDTTHYGDD